MNDGCCLRTGGVLNLELCHYGARIAGNKEAFQMVYDHLVHAVGAHGCADHHREFLARLDLASAVSDVITYVVRASSAKRRDARS